MAERRKKSKFEKKKIKFEDILFDLKFNLYSLMLSTLIEIVNHLNLTTYLNNFFLVINMEELIRK
jgi:hypothetical protein